MDGFIGAQSPISGLELVDTATMAPPRSRGMLPGSLEVFSGRPTNIVFHGHRERFSYEYFGIHQGTEDRLTFCGPSDRQIEAFFIDCRHDSPSWGVRFAAELRPTTSQCLVIPPGVAHTFDGLEDVYTVNSFRNFLPDPNDWVNGIVRWELSADTINVPRAARDAEIPKVRYNKLEASRKFYRITSRNIEDALDGVVFEYPLTREVSFDDGTKSLLNFKKRQPTESAVPKWEAVSDFEGSGLRRRLYVVGGDSEDSGYTVVRATTQFEVKYMPQPETIRIDGADNQTDLSFTFFGEESCEVGVRLSKDFNKSSFLLKPSPLRELVVKKGTSVEIDVPASMVCLLSWENDE